MLIGGGLIAVFPERVAPVLRNPTAEIVGRQ